MLTVEARNWTGARRRWGAALVAAALLALLFPGAAPALDDDDASPVVSRRLDAVPGRTLVIPLRGLDRDAPRRVRSARLADGREIPIGWHRVIVGAADEPCDERGWSGSPGRWSSVDPSEEEGRGTLIITVELPEDASGQAVWLGRLRVVPNWLPVPGAVEDDGAFESPLPPERRGSESLAGLIEADRLSPTRRWRWLLTLGEFGADRGSEPEWRDETGGLAAVASHMEDRWRAALAMLHRADPDTARRLRARLAGAADFGGGAIAPVRAIDDATAEEFLEALFEPGLSPEALKEVAESWIRSAPSGVAWVIDDAGRQDGLSGDFHPTIGVLHFGDRDAVALAARPDAVERPALESVRAWEAGRVRGVAPVRLDPGSAVGSPVPVAPLRVRVGGWDRTLDVAAGLASVGPPGLRIGPLLRDWEMDAWVRGSVESGSMPAMPEMTGALLYMVGSDGADAAERFGSRARGRTGRWRLYVECASPGAGGDGALDGERVRVWLGPYERPNAVLRVTPDGAVRDEIGGETRWVDVTADGGVWAFSVDVPDAAIETDGVLRLGIERRGACGRRTAWPRRMLPWQDEPGRVAIDTESWPGYGRGP